MKPILIEQAKPFFSGAMVFAEIAGTNWLKLSSNTLLIMAPEYRYRPFRSLVCCGRNDDYF